MTPQLRATPIGRRVRLHSAEVLASIGVAVAALTLIALVWLAEARSIESESNDVRTRVEATLTGQALVLSDQIRREMLEVEQSLLLLKQAFQTDPDHFDMDAWRKQMPALADVTDDVFIADAQNVIRHDINRSQIGMAIGAHIVGMFGPVKDKLDPDESLLIGPTMQTLQTRQHLMLMVMRLDRPGGWVVGAAYRTAALKRLFAETNLGLRGMTELIDTRLNRVAAVVGPAAANPNYEIASSAMHAAMQLRPDGTWTGASAPDGVQRIHAFRQVPGRQLTVIVAVDESDAMRPATTWAQDVRMLALIATLVVLAVTGVALYAVWIFRDKSRLRESLGREQMLVTNAQVELSEARIRLADRAWQFQALFDGIDEGALVLDAELHLAEWNQHFAALFGIAPAALRPGLPLDELLRIQAREGEFGTLDDVEGEVAIRLGQLSGDAGTVPTIYAGPGGRALAVFTSRHDDGGRLLILRGATEDDRRKAAEVPDAPALEEAPTSGSAETF